MNIEQLCQLGYADVVKPLQVEGELIFSALTAMIIDKDPDDSTRNPSAAILVEPELLQDLERLPLIRNAGTTVQFTGRIKLLCALRHSGLPFLPIYVQQIYQMTFWNNGNSWTFNYAEPEIYQHIYLLCPNNVSPAILHALKPFFASDLSEQDIKASLQAEKELLVGKQLPVHKITPIIQLLEQAGIGYRLEHTDEPYYEDWLEYEIQRM